MDAVANNGCLIPGQTGAWQRGMAQRGLSKPDPDKLIKQANRLTRLVDDMLDISRINAGKLALERAPADLSALVQSRAHLRPIRAGRRIQRGELARA